MLQRDREAIAEIYRTFYEAGFAVRPSPTYDDLMTATDQHGAERSYLATEENYSFLKDLESRNMVVPVVGDFGGPTAIRAVAKYLKANGATVTAFYLSNANSTFIKTGSGKPSAGTSRPCHWIAPAPLFDPNPVLAAASAVLVPDSSRASARSQATLKHAQVSDSIGEIRF
jgi:hypothetical protein